MSFPRYAKYKDSGVEWLGQVPEHWDLKRLRYISKVRKGKLPGETFPAPTADTDLPYLSMEFLRGESENTNYVPVSPNLLCAESGDLLLLWDGSNAGEFLRAKRGVVSSTVALIESRNIEKEFLFFACKARERQLRDQTVGMGIPHVSGDELMSFSIPCPSPAEQTCIAEFLNQETTKIDRLVREQLRLMELLKEKRLAVISHAVTQGLNPHVPMKPSGIEWLGDVPEHWKIMRLAYNAAIENGTTPSRDNPDYWLGGDIPWLSSGEVNQYRITEANEFVTKKALAECSLRLLPRGTIVVGMIGQGKTRGLSASLEIEASINQNLAAIVPGKNLKPDYLLYIFQSMYEYLREFGRGGNQAALNCEILSALKMPLPPVEEQLHICNYLEARLKEFDTLTTEAQRAIDLLQERRTALISAAVTGQIDVRPLLKKEAA